MFEKCEFLDKLRIFAPVCITECLNNNNWDCMIFESDRHIFASPVAKFVYKYSRGYENVILAKKWINFAAHLKV